MNKVLQILVVLTFPIWFPIVALFNALFNDGDSFDGAYNEMRNRTNGDDDETSDWPEEDRIDIIGQNGNNGEHYD